MTTIKINMTFSMALNFIAIALAITGTPTKAGEVEITVTLQIPLVRGFGSRFPNNVHVGSPTATKVTRTFTLTIGE